jgi:hypothetical protein
LLQQSKLLQRSQRPLLHRLLLPQIQRQKSLWRRRTLWMQRRIHQVLQNVVQMY